ncbi:hypothetical protein GEMRC1_012538 [Eukaryota sp. GEM-RC1]
MRSKLIQTSLLLALLLSVGFPKLEFYPAESKTSEKEYQKCMLCRASWQYVRMLAMDPVIMKGVVDYVNDLCQHFGQYSKSCADTANNYILPTISFVVAATPSDEACAMLNICPDPAKYLEPMFEETNMSQDQCAVCQDISSTINELIGSKQFQYDVVRMAFDHCSVLKSTSPVLCTICQDISLNLLPVYLKRLDEYVHDQDICSFIAACKG